MPVAASFLEVQHLQVRYTSERQVTQAIGDVSFNVERGDFVSIVGPSGCGKSTLLKVIGGLLPAQQGSVTLGGKVITAPPRNVIYLFQDYSKSVFPWLTALENVTFGLRNREGHLSLQEVDAAALEHLDLVGLKDFAQYYPRQLSGGMQQRVAIARALICRPEVLLLDEPFGAIDALNRSDLQDLLLDLWQRFKLTILFVTHDIEESIYVSRRVISLSKAPAQTVLDLSVDLAYPRDQMVTREDPKYLEYRRVVHAAVTGAGRRPLRTVSGGMKP